MDNNKNSGPDDLQLRPGPKARHGGYTFLRTGRLPAKRAYIERYLTWLRQTYIDDIAGSEEAMSAGQTVLLNKLVLIEGLCRCIEETAAEIAEGVGAIPVMPQNYLSYVNSIVKICGMLGIERKEDAESLLTPLQIANEYDKKKGEKRP